MKELDPQHLFYDCPYPVKLDDGAYIFRTDHDIVYAVSFKQEPFFDPIPAYWFDLTNRSGKASPSDSKVRETVILSLKAKWWSTRAWRTSSPSSCRAVIPTWVTS